MFIGILIAIYFIGICAVLISSMLFIKNPCLMFTANAMGAFSWFGLIVVFVIWIAERIYEKHKEDFQETR